MKRWHESRKQTVWEEEDGQQDLVRACERVTVGEYDHNEFCTCMELKTTDNNTDKLYSQCSSQCYSKMQG